jgi:hypothetical protein
MRSLECLLSAEARSELIEAALVGHRRLSIQRKTDVENIISEDWRMGSRLRGERLDMFFDPVVQAWRTFFGFGSSGMMIRKIVSARNDCSWIWPETGLPPDTNAS